MSTSPYTPGVFHSHGGDQLHPHVRVNASVAMCSEPDVMKRDRFELLSAYLDGEVTPEERRLVQTWLSNDPTAKCLYNRLMALRYGLREDACTEPCDAEVTLSAVFQGLNQRFRMMSMAGAGVVILGALHLLSGDLGTGSSPWQMAQTSTPASLQIALDQPAFPIPDVTQTVPIEGAALGVTNGLPIGSDL